MKRPTAEEFSRWQESLALSAVQVGYLARATVEEGVGSARARAGEGRRYTRCMTVEKWRSGERRVPLVSWELLQTKSVLLKLKLATLEELLTIPLPTLIERLHANAAHPVQGK